MPIAYELVVHITLIDFVYVCSFKPRQIIKHDEFLRLSHERLIDLLKCDDLVVKSEEQVYESALAWIRYDLSDRRQYIATVMANIRFPMMQRSYLISHVDTERLLKDDAECNRFIFGAYQWYAFKEHPSRSSVFVPHTNPRLIVQTNLLVVGGMSRSIEYYDIRDGQMRQGADMPSIRKR